MRPSHWLRLEGLAVLALSLVLYGRTGFDWLPFAALLLAPDLSMAGYLAGPRAGADLYNLFHCYAAPLGLAAVGLAAGSAPLLAGALIWTSHIGMDRLLGYGLKHRSGFRDTHLGRIGRD